MAATIVYDNRFEQTEYLAGGGGGEEQGAMAEIVLVRDRTSPESEPYVLKRPMISSGGVLSQRQLQIQNEAIVKELKALEIAWKLQDKLACEITEVIKSGVDDRNFPPHSYKYFIITRAPGRPLSGIKFPVPLITIFNIYAKIIKSLRVLHNNHVVYNDTRHEHFFWDESIDPIANRKESITLIDFGNAYFLPGSSLENYNFKDALERKTARDDYIQLAQSFYRLLTGNELQPSQLSADFHLKQDYDVVSETIDFEQFKNQISLIVNHLLEGDYDVAYNILLKWVGVFEQHRENEFSKIDESLNLYKSFTELGIRYKEKYLVIGNPDNHLLGKWEKYYAEIAYNETLEKTKKEVSALIEAREWKKLLAGPLIQLFRHDPDFRSLLGSIIENLKDQKVSDEQVSIIAKLFSNNSDEAKNDIPKLFNQTSSLTETEIKESLLPFAEKIYKYQEEFHPSASYSMFYLECRNLQFPEQVLEKYKKLLTGEFGAIAIENRKQIEKIIELLDQAIIDWFEIAFEKVIAHLDQVLELDRLNPAVRAWDTTCREYKSWLNRTQTWPGSIPAPEQYSHKLFDAIQTLSPSVEQSKFFLDTIQEAENKLTHRLLVIAQNSFDNWIINKRNELKKAFEDSARIAFDKPDKSILSLFVDDTDQSRYLSKNLLEWYQLCFCVFYLAEKQQKQDLKELKKYINQSAENGSQHYRWDLLKKGMSYFEARLNEHQLDSGFVENAKMAFERAALQISSRGNLHWLYRLFVLGDQTGTAGGFFRIPSFPKPVPETNLETTNIQEHNFFQKVFSWQGTPIISFFTGLLFGSIAILLVSIAILQFTNVELTFVSLAEILKPSEETPPQTMPVDTSTPCEQANNYIKVSEYSMAQELLRKCTTKEEQEKTAITLVSQLETDIPNKKYDPYMKNVIQQTINWNNVNQANKLTDLYLCSGYLELKNLGEDSQMHNAFDEMVDWIDLGPPALEVKYDSWQASCGWQPSELLLSSINPPLPYRGTLAPDLEIGTYRLYIDSYSEPLLKYLPKTMRRYEIMAIINADEQKPVTLQDSSLPDFFYKVDFTELSSKYNLSEFLIKFFWNYRLSDVEIGYSIYVPFYEFPPGYSTEFDNLNVFEFEGRRWYWSNTDSKFLQNDRSEKSLAFQAPEIIFNETKPESFPNNFTLFPIEMELNP